MAKSTKIALFLGFLIMVLGQLRTLNHGVSDTEEPIETSQAQSLVQSLAQATAPVQVQAPIQAKAEIQSETRSEPEVAAQTETRHPRNSFKPGPLHERLFPKSRVISEEQTGPNEEGVITKIQILQTDYKYPLVRLEERWKGDKPLPPVAMVANHLMVEKKAGMSDADFRKAIEATGAVINKMIPDTGIYIIGFEAHDAHSIDQMQSQLADATSPASQVTPDFIRFVN